MKNLASRQFKKFIFLLQWTLWTSPGPGLAATIKVDKTKSSIRVLCEDSALKGAGGGGAGGVGGEGGVQQELLQAQLLQRTQ